MTHRSVLSMAHKFGPHLTCLTCGVSWMDHQTSQDRCGGTNAPSPDSQSQSDEESLPSDWVRSDFKGGESITTISRRYSISRGRVSRMIREG